MAVSRPAQSEGIAPEPSAAAAALCPLREMHAIAQPAQRNIFGPKPSRRRCLIRREKLAFTCHVAVDLST